MNSNGPQGLIDAMTGHLESSQRDLSGNPTYQELVYGTAEVPIVSSFQKSLYTSVDSAVNIQQS